LQAPLQLGEARQSLIGLSAQQSSLESNIEYSLFEGIDVLLEASGDFARDLLTGWELVD
jgi:hypothetical protein